MEDFKNNLDRNEVKELAEDSKATEVLFRQRKKEISMKIWLNLKLFVMNMNI